MAFDGTEEETKEEPKSKPEASPKTEKEPKAKQPKSTAKEAVEETKEEVEEKAEEGTEPESTEESWNPFDTEESLNLFDTEETKEPEPALKKKRASRDEIYAALDKGYTKEQIMEEFKVSTKTYNRRKEEWLTKKKNNINSVPEAKTAKVTPEIAKPKTSGYEWKKFKREED